MRSIVGLTVGLVSGLVLALASYSFTQEGPARPRVEGATRWVWPTGLEPVATLVGPAQVRAGGPGVSSIFTLTFRESSGAIKIVEIAWEGGPAPREYSVITLSPR